MFSFFFNDTATTEIYTLSLHDALPISPTRRARLSPHHVRFARRADTPAVGRARAEVLPLARSRRKDAGARRVLQEARSEEHTSELQSRQYLVCRLLLEKKKSKRNKSTS